MRGGLDDHHRVELEPVGLPGREQHQRRAQPLPGRVPGVDRVEARGRRRARCSSGTSSSGARTAARPGATAAELVGGDVGRPGRQARARHLLDQRERARTAAPASAASSSGTAARSARAATSTTSAGVR